MVRSAGEVNAPAKVELLHGGVRIADAEIASSRSARRRGLLGRTGIEGVFVLSPCRGVHTIGMQMAIDVAYLGRTGKVLRIRTMPRHRIGLPVLRSHTVLEAAAGAFSRWSIAQGDVLTLR